MIENTIAKTMLIGVPFLDARVVLLRVRRDLCRGSRAHKLRRYLRPLAAPARLEALQERLVLGPGPSRHGE